MFPEEGTPSACRDLCHSHNTATIYCTAAILVRRSLANAGCLHFSSASTIAASTCGHAPKNKIQTRMHM